MTTTTNAELIAEARELLPVETINYSPEHDYIAHLADALEAAEQRADLADADLEVEQQKNAGYRSRNDALAVVVEKVRDLTADPGGFTYKEFDRISRGIPADALREHDAALIEELADEWHADNTGTSPRAYNWLRDKARQRRKEQS